MNVSRIEGGKLQHLQKQRVLPFHRKCKSAAFSLISSFKQQLELSEMKRQKAFFNVVCVEVPETNGIVRI